MKKINSFFKEIISSIYPNKCICCTELINEEEQICSKCNSLIERNSLDDICLSCGFEKSECVCKYSVYRFNSLVCVFKNTGFAKKAYYAYKFAKRKHYANFFAAEMSEAIKKCYKDIKIDFICSVPNVNRFGYDHSGYLANEISKLLDIPYIHNVLSCAKITKKQHKSKIKERINNVDGKYKCNVAIDDANILLVDDIKTTGSTIDECTRILLFSGAQNVYCITALGASQTKN